MASLALASSETFLPVAAAPLIETLSSSSPPSSPFPSPSPSSSSSADGGVAVAEAVGNPSPNPNSDALPNPNSDASPSPNQETSPTPNPEAGPNPGPNPNPGSDPSPNCSPSPDCSPSAEEGGSGERKTAWKTVLNRDLDCVVAFMGDESWPALSRQKQGKQPPGDSSSGSRTPDAETSHPQQARVPLPAFVSTVADSSKGGQGNSIEGHIRNSPKAEDKVEGHIKNSLKAEDKVPVAVAPPPIAIATNQVMRSVPTEFPSYRPPFNNFAKGGGEGGAKPSWQQRGAPEQRDLGRFQSNTWNNRSRHPRELPAWNSYNRPHNNGWDHGKGGLEIRATGPGNFPFGNPHFPVPNQGYANANFQNGPGSMPYYVPLPAQVPVYPNQDAQFYVNIQAKLKNQIEYYFSVENLCKDLFLRRHMDMQGFVPVSFISSFKRVQRLTQDPVMILDALRTSEVVEVHGDKLRARSNWSNWLLLPLPQQGVGMGSERSSSGDSSA